MGAKAFGVQSPTQGETAVSWQTWSDGAATVPTIDGDSDWGKLKLDLSGEEGRSAVYDLGSEAIRTFTLTENRYGTGEEDAFLQYRTSTTSFSQDDEAPSWTTYSSSFSINCRYVQIREITNIGTTYEVGTSVEVVDGRVSPYDALQPGDTIALLAGTHHPITFKNIMGDAANPIRIINSGGLVEFTDTSHENAIVFKNCEYFRLTGSGYGGVTYGIMITSFNSKAILGTCKTRNCEIDHIKIMENTAATGIGIHILNYGLPGAYVNSYNWDAYDYDGDSSLDADDELDGRYWTAENIKIHDCHFDGTASTYNLDVPIYIGYSNYTETPHTRDLYDADHNLDTGVTVYFPPSENVEVYDCLFEHTNMKCVQIGSCLTGCLVHDNVFSDVCYQVAEHDPVISINPADSGVRIYNNRMIGLNNGVGIYSYGEEVRIYNNVIINPGYYGMIVQALKPAGYHHYESTWVMNNTIVSSYNAQCVAWANSEGSNDRCQNNILINTYGSYISGTLDASSNNYTNTNVDNAGFTDHDNNDYTLTSGSPCRNAGTDLSSYGVIDDIAGTARPQGSTYDEGAYEYIE